MVKNAVCGSRASSGGSPRGCNILQSPLKCHNVFDNDIDFVLATNILDFIIEVFFIYFFYYYYWVVSFVFILSTAITITRPRFSGLDEFGYSSYMAYPSISSMSYFYEFRLKLTFSNNSTAMKNNLILFSGQKGQGERGCNTYTNTHGKLISVCV